MDCTCDLLIYPPNPRFTGRPAALPERSAFP